MSWEMRKAMNHVAAADISFRISSRYKNIPRMPIQIAQPLNVSLVTCLESARNKLKKTKRPVMDAYSAPRITVVGASREYAMSLVVLCRPSRDGDDMYCEPFILDTSSPKARKMTRTMVVQVQSALGKSLKVLVW